MSNPSWHLQFAQSNILRKCDGLSSLYPLCFLLLGNLKANKLKGFY